MFLDNINIFLNTYRNLVNSGKEFTTVENRKINKVLIRLFIIQKYIIKSVYKNNKKLIQIIIDNNINTGLKAKKLEISPILENKNNMNCSYKKVEYYYKDLLKNPNCNLFIGTSMGVLTYQDMIHFKKQGRVLFYIQ
jgi:hypothetical protein